MRKKKLQQKVLALGKDAEKAKTELDQHVKTSKGEIEKANSQIITLKCMTRTFWECWKWEVEKRKDKCLLHRRTKIDHLPKSSAVSNSIHQIDPCSLLNSGEAKYYLGCGSFGVVTYKMYRELVYSSCKENAH